MANEQKQHSEYKIDDFTRGQMCGVLNLAIGGIGSVRDLEYGADSDDRAKLNQACKLIGEVINKYGIFEETKGEDNGTAEVN